MCKCSRQVKVLYANLIPRTKAYLEICQTFKIECPVKIVSGF